MGEGIWEILIRARSSIFCILSAALPLAGCVSLGVTPTADGQGRLSNVGATIQVTPDFSAIAAAMRRPNTDLPKPTSSK